MVYSAAPSKKRSCCGPTRLKKRSSSRSNCEIMSRWRSDWTIAFHARAKRCQSREVPSNEKQLPCTAWLGFGLRFGLGLTLTS